MTLKSPWTYRLIWTSTRTFYLTHHKRSLLWTMLNKNGFCKTEILKNEFTTIEWASKDKQQKLEASRSGSHVAGASIRARVQISNCTVEKKSQEQSPSWYGRVDPKQYYALSTAWRFPSFFRVFPKTYFRGPAETTVWNILGPCASCH